MPWMVLLLEDGVPMVYILKLFSEKTTLQQHPVAKEVLGSVLAREFGLFSPDYALVELDDAFINTFLDAKQQSILATKHNGLKFASRYQEGMPIFSPAKHKKFLRPYDIANIFAFDCLIYNIDRGRRADKPNLLVEDDNYLLIDHELCLPFIDNEAGLYNMIMEKFNRSELDYSYKNHLLYKTIKSYRNKYKEDIFSEFEDNLRRLNINIIRETIAELIELNISVGNHQRIIDYLCYLKDNAHSFCQILISCANR